MDQRVPRIPDRADEINLGEIAQQLLRQWPIIVACMAVACLAGLLTLRFATYVYTAELKVTPAPNAQNSLSLRQQLGGLASLAGLSLPNNQEATPFFLYGESVASRAVADKLAMDSNLMKVVFRDEWDPASNSFVKKKTSFESLVTAIAGIIGIPSYPWTPPDGARLQLYLKTNVEVIEDPKKPIVTLTYDHRDPAFAVAFLTALDHAIDSELRQKTLTRVKDNIAYLSGQLSTITNTEHRQVITQALSEQEKVGMAASSTAPVAAEIVSGPDASFRPTKPRPVLVIAATVFAGLFLGIIVALAREWFLGHGTGRLRRRHIFEQSS